MTIGYAQENRLRARSPYRCWWYLAGALGRLTSATGVEKESALPGDEFGANPKWQLTRAYTENRANATVARQPETQRRST